MKARLKKSIHFPDGSGIRYLIAKKGSMWEIEPATNLPVPTDGTTRYWGVPLGPLATQEEQDMHWLATEGIGCLIELPEDAELVISRKKKPKYVTYEDVIEDTAKRIADGIDAEVMDYWKGEEVE